MKDLESDRQRPQLRMASALAVRARAEGGFVQLARRITEVYSKPRRPPRKDVVDRRKLSAIADGEHVHFAPDELRALDLYLEAYGEGLTQQPLFYRPQLLQALAEAGDVTFLLGSKLERRHKRLEFSHWDVTGATSILREVSRYSPHARLDIQEVRREPQPGEQDRPETWPALLEDGPSLVALGSPRANHASEYMLARMFGIRPRGRRAGEQRPPFRFVWEKDMPFNSSFALAPKDLPPEDRARMDTAEYAIYIDDRFAPAALPTGAETVTTYGVVVAQRQPNGKLWIVLAGLTGAATYAAARAISRIGLVPEKGTSAASVGWTPVNVTIRGDGALFRVDGYEPGRTRWMVAGATAKSWQDGSS